MPEQKSIKEVILRGALSLFNKNGFVNVRLQHIADAAEISVGHMAYHYKNKEAILSAIYEQLNQRQRIHLAEFRIVPLFEDIDRQIKSNFKLQQDFIFFYQDMLEIMRGFTAVKSIHQQQIGWQIQQIQTMINFNVARGVFVNSHLHDQVRNTAYQYWASSEFWCYQQSVAGLPHTEYQHFRNSVWSVLTPLLTHVGKIEYAQLSKPMIN